MRGSDGKARELAASWRNCLQGSFISCPESLKIRAARKWTANRCRLIFGIARPPRAQSMPFDFTETLEVPLVVLE